MAIPYTIQECIALYSKGERQIAFDCISRMKIRDMTAAQRKVLGVAAEMLAGKNLAFYASIGKTLEKAVAEADIVFYEFFIERKKK